MLQNSHSKLKEKSRITEKDTNDFVEYFQNEINFLNEKNLGMYMIVMNYFVYEVLSLCPFSRGQNYKRRLACF